MSPLSKRLTFRSRLTILAVGMISLFFVFSLGLLSYSTYRSLILDQQSYQERIANLLFESVKQPLLQGSFFEAKARLQMSLARGEADCIQLKVQTFDFEECHPQAGSTLIWSERRLSEVPELSGYDGIFRIAFSQAAARQRFLYQMIWVLVIALASALLVGFLIRIGFRVLNKEVEQLTETLSEDVNRPLEFRTLEFDLLHRRLRELLETKSKLIQSEAFASIAKSVVHDIRSPLSTLKILSQKGVPDPNSLTLLGMVTKRLEGIANNLLNYSVELERKEHDLRPLEGQVQELITEYQARTSSVEFELEMTKDFSEAPISGAFKPAEVCAFLDNLLKNSVEAHAQKIQVNVRLEGARLHLVVSDDGSGVPAEVIAQLGVTPISRGKHEGSGMGLFLLIKKAKSFGGDLTLEAKKPKGTIAHLTLPLGAGKNPFPT